MVEIENGAGFGIPQLDRLLPKGPRGSAILIANDPGVDAEPFLYQACYHHLKEGRRVFYLVANRSPSAIAAAFESFGFDLEEHRGRLAFIDAFSRLMGASEHAAFEVEDPSDLGKVVAMIEKAAGDGSDAVLVIDSLSSLIDNASEPAFRASFEALHRAMKRFETSFSLFTSWPYAGAVDEALAAFDAVVGVHGVEERVLFGQYFVVERARWVRDLEPKRLLYRALRPGGVFAYIPKILVTGPYNAGKSTFIHAVSDEAVSVDRFGTTVALDHGHVTIEGLTADIFGTPGQSRFEPILRVLEANALGVIIVLDATKPDTFERAQDMLDRARKLDLPAIVVANKQDVSGAAAPEAVAARLKGPHPVEVVPCIGNDPDSARGVLRRLIERIMEQGTAP